jgi:hypothetical protein
MDSSSERIKHIPSDWENVHKNRNEQKASPMLGVITQISGFLLYLLTTGFTHSQNL